MSEKNEVKNCPFCGSDDLDLFDADPKFHIYCNKCEMSVAFHTSRKHAIEFWNTRTEAKTPSVEIDGLEGLGDEVHFLYTFFDENMKCKDFKGLLEYIRELKFSTDGLERLDEKEISKLATEFCIRVDKWRKKLGEKRIPDAVISPPFENMLRKFGTPKQLERIGEVKLREIFEDKLIERIERVEEGSRGTWTRFIYSLSPISFALLILQKFGTQKVRYPEKMEILGSVGGDPEGDKEASIYNQAISDMRELNKDIPESNEEKI